MENLQRRLTNSLAILGLFLPASFVVGFYMYMGIFTRLIADDYCSMYYARRLGLFRSIWYWYITWHGGFSVSATDWFLSFTGPGFLHIMAVITLTAWVSSAVFVSMKVFFPGNSSKSSFFQSLLLGTILIFATMVISPDITQSFFWWGGARGYFFPLVLAMLYLCVYLIFLSSSWRPWQLMVWYLASFALVFFVCGFAEVFTPVLVVIFTGSVLWSWLVRKLTLKDASYRFLLAGFLGAFLSLIVMVSAPGNSLRGEYFPAPPNLFTVLSISVNGYMIFLQSIFGSFVLTSCVLGSMLAVIWIGNTSRYNSILKPQKPWQAFIVLIIGFILAFGCFPAAAYGVSEPPPLRTQIIPSFLLMVGVMTSSLMFGKWLGDYGYESSTMRVVLLIFASVLIWISGWSETQFLLSIRHDHVSFAQKWDWVDAKIENAKLSGADVVYIPAMENWAGLEYPKNKSKYWVNVCFSQYYDIKVLAPPQGE